MKGVEGVSLINERAVSGPKTDAGFAGAEGGFFGQFGWVGTGGWAATLVEVVERQKG